MLKALYSFVNLLSSFWSFVREQLERARVSKEVQTEIERDSLRERNKMLNEANAIEEAVSDLSDEEARKELEKWSK